MGMTSAEMYQSLNNTAELARQDREHHNEMMELLDRLQALKVEYKKLGDAYDDTAAARDAAFSIISEHQDAMGITEEDVNMRIKEFQAAKKSNPAAPTRYI